MFSVPLYTPDQPKAHTYSLCYEIHGTPNNYYNFISDGCTSVNARYFSTSDPDPDSTRNFHAVNGIYIQAVKKNQDCVRITVTLGSDNTCTTSIGGVSINNYDSYGVTVSVTGNTTMVSVPNCADGALVMSVHCKTTSSGIGYQEFRVIRGLNLNEVSHGIIGKLYS